VLVVAGALVAVAEGVVLELALAGLVADRAVQRMVDEEELHVGRARLHDLLRRRLHRQPFLQRGRARRLDLRDPLDLDQAHPALPDHREARVKAEVRDLDARGLGRLDQIDVLRDLDRLSVEEDRVRVLWRRRGRRRLVVAHAWTATASAFGSRALPGPTRHRRFSTW